MILEPANRKAVVLFSGGLDSTVVLSLACWGYQEVHALTFYYGQRHAEELARARSIAAEAGVKHHTGMVDPSIWKLVPLCRSDGEIPEGRTVHAIRDGGVPSTFVPGRNVVFLSHALALAGVLGGADVLIGATREDQIGYPDCRWPFFGAFQEVARIAVPESRIVVRAPLVEMTKREVVALGRSMAIDFDRTWSCYRPLHQPSGSVPCGRCDACVLRQDALGRRT